jgi:hypothetical protein
MIESDLRNRISIFLIVSHLLIFLLLIATFVAGGLTQSEFTTSLSVVVPMLAALTGLAIGYVTSVKKKSQLSAFSEELAGVYVFTSFLLPIVFVLAVAGVIAVKVVNYVSFEQFKIILAAVETTFGGYTGKVMASLFDKQQEQAK